MRAALVALALLASVAAAAEVTPAPRQLTVWATAYNGVPGQTDDDPHVGAWGDNLEDASVPGVRVIAVSPDLLEKGLKRGQRVRIRGLRGEFIVLDKMPSRWKNRIDIYMHKDLRGARKWGKRKVTLSWKD
ncbi:MAG TPA: hypothetical protein VM240_13220 [Verrucomicrobiae bacterium]|nr:hypothetical protein [Verrucomicrobiae bacterium]